MTTPAPMVQLPAELPTTPGSVIEAGSMGHGPFLWMLADNGRSWISTAGAWELPSNMTVLRVLFDAAPHNAGGVTPRCTRCGHGESAHGETRCWGCKGADPCVTFDAPVVDAAAPAASVPAANILALAEHCEKVSVDSNESEQWQRAHTAFAGWLRALVAATEQADKGEATTAAELNAMSGASLVRDENERVAPAAPVGGTVEIGGEAMTEAQFNAARFPLLNPHPGPAVEGDEYRPNAPRVPVNDEAEAAERAQTLAYRWLEYGEDTVEYRLGWELNDALSGEGNTDE